MNVKSRNVAVIVPSALGGWLMVTLLDLALAWPGPVVSDRLGVLRATLILSPLYFVGSLGLVWLLVRALSLPKPDRKVEHLSARIRGLVIWSFDSKWLKKLLKGAKLVGFVAASCYLGGFLFSLFLWLSGLRGKRFWRLATTSCAIFAVWYVPRTDFLWAALRWMVHAVGSLL